MVEQMGSTNEAKKFEEVTRIIFFEVDTPYDILGVNWKASFDDIKKRYLKLSLMVHPDKCSHPQAHHAFMRLNQAYKDLQNSEKRKAFDKKFRVKEVQEAFIICALKKRAELKAMREAAWWRHLRGMSPLVGDAELLGIPKKKPKEGSDDTTVEKSMSAKQKSSDDADLMDKYELAKRSKSLLAQKHAWRHIYEKPAKRSMQKHREEREQPERRTKRREEHERPERRTKCREERERPERRTKEAAAAAKREEEWHPWDLDKEDLASGRQKNADLNSGGLARLLVCHFSSSSLSAAQRKKI